nr:MAG: replication associated protein [Cressdnaviricota sp.]
MAEEKNTVSTGKFRINRKKSGFTYAQSGDTTKEELLTFFQSLGTVTNYVIGREAHKEGGYHLHAQIEWANAIDTTDQRYFDFNELHPNIIAPKKGNYWRNYCMKQGDFISDICFDDTTDKNFRKRKADYDSWKLYHRNKKDIKMEEITLREWEIKAIEMLEEEPVRRRIIWIWSQESKTGKSTFKDYCCNKYKGKILITDTEKMTDILYAYDEHEIIWFDLTRSVRLENELYRALEKLSDNGYVLSTKYESKNKKITAHIVVTSNEQPPVHILPERIVSIKATTDQIESEVRVGP